MPRSPNSPCLQRSGDKILAYHLGHAIDEHRDELLLKRHEREPILTELRSRPIEALDEFRRVLEQQAAELA